MQETWVQSQGQEDPLEKEMSTHSSTFAWKIPHGQRSRVGHSPRGCRVRHDWATSLLHSWCKKRREGEFSLDLLLKDCYYFLLSFKMECLLLAWPSQRPFLPQANRGEGSDRGASHSHPCPQPSRLSRIPNNKGVTLISHWALPYSSVPSYGQAVYPCFRLYCASGRRWCVIGSKEIEVKGQEMDLPKDLLSTLHFQAKSPAFI